MLKKLLFLSLILTALAGKAIADIGIFPQAVDFEANSRKKSQTLSVINNSDHAQTYRISIVHYKQTEDGKYEETDALSNSAAKFLMFSPKQFTLQPGKIQSIRVARKNLGNLPDGEYVAYLRVQEAEMPSPKKKGEEDAEGLSISLKMLFAANIPVTIYKGDNLNVETSIDSYKINDNKINVVLKRTGNISSRVNLIVLDDKGEEIGRAGPLRIYPTNDHRNVSIELKKDNTKIPAVLKLEDAKSKAEITRKTISK